MAALAYWIAVGITVLVLVSGGTGASVRRVRQPSRVRCLLLGDSFGVGLAEPLRIECERTDAGAPGYWLTLRVQRGATATDWIGDVEALLAHKYDTLFVSLGTNDCVESNSVTCSRFGDAIRHIMTSAKRHGTYVMFIVPSWLRADWKERIQARIKANGGIIVETERPEISPDGLHPTLNGYKQWARAIAARWRLS